MKYYRVIHFNNYAELVNLRIDINKGNLEDYKSYIYKSKDSYPLLHEVICNTTRGFALGIIVEEIDESEKLPFNPQDYPISFIFGDVHKQFNNMDELMQLVKAEGKYIEERKKLTKYARATKKLNEILSTLSSETIADIKANTTYELRDVFGKLELLDELGYIKDEE